MDPDEQSFETVVQVFQSELAALGAQFAWDGSVRTAYAQEIKKMASTLRRQAIEGRISWAQAASEATQTRNATMQIARYRTSPIGLSIAKEIKAQGPTLNALIGQRTIKLYGANARFDNLTAAQKNVVYRAVIEGAGRSNPQVNTLMRRLGAAGRGMLFLSLGVAVYAIATAEDPVDAAVREGAVFAAGVAGGVAGSAAAGAVAGLACGPGAPVCVVIGAFIGGGLAAFSVRSVW
ncbi:MAG: hypothetical protein ACFB2Z_03715 [Maricaulaceae bacterium]